MTLEVSNPRTGRKSDPVLAKVRFVRLPGNPRELYSVGIELEKPANVWGIESVPEDWLPYLDPANATAGMTQAVGSAPEIKTAVQAEHPAPGKAAEIANQQSIVKIADRIRDCDTILVPARAGFLDRLNKELADAGERLFEWAAAFVTRTQTTPQSLSVENGFAQIQPAATEAKRFSKKLVSGQVRVGAGKDVRYWIKIDVTKMVEPTVTGWFRASGGSPSDIALVLATEQEFENLVHGCEAKVLLAIDSIKSGEFQVSIAQSGSYILAFDNRLSIFMPRTFTANIDLYYSTRGCS